MKWHPLVATTLSAVLLAGCSMQTPGRAERATDLEAKNVTRYLDEARAPAPVAETSQVKMVDSVFATASARRSDHGLPLPYRLEHPGIGLASGHPMELFEIGTKITQATGLPVSFAPDVYGDSRMQQAEAQEQQQATASSSQAAGPPTPHDLNNVLGSLGLNSGGGGGNTSNASGGVIREVTESRMKMLVDYKGALSGFLDQAGSHFGISWTYTDGQIRFYRNITRTFLIHALPINNLALNSSMSSSSSSSGGDGGGSSGSSTGGGSDQKSSADVALKIWDDLTQTVKSIVGSDGKVATAVSTGSITVTAPIEVIDRVQTFIDGQNANLAKQVTVNVQVLNLQLSDSDSNTLDMQGLMSSASKYGLMFGNTAGAAAATIMKNSNEKNPALGFNINSGKLSGTNAIIQALSERGRVSVVTTNSITTMNGIPAPFQFTNLRGYLKQVQTTNQSGTASSTDISNNTQTTLTPGSVTTGYNLTLLPRIMDDNRSLLMQVQINISNLNGANNGFDSVTSGGQMIQLPNINGRNMVQSSEVPNGATFAVAGFEQVQNTSNKSGSGTPEFMALGGSQSGSQVRNLLVILMTPVVADMQAAITSN